MSDNKLLFTGYMTGSKRYFTKDNLPKIIWSLKNESKEILGYKCYKAEGTFRGRNWIAWYSPQIASQLGPWKIGGLPGLVLEAYTDKDEYKYTARRILTNSNLTVPQGIIDYINEKKGSIIPFKEYIEKENEFIQSLSSEQLSSMPTGTTSVKQPLRNAQIESLFEWED
ncbi:GLPGLI family protein [Chryseobacterium sp.]|uniref:GLPGLI family protein n=1 Tax=Chryseobacterium sp. TaxID=1871047 RepID=UPI00289D00DB|nr:GLPGLI family protein [Chryseobacterium sp.]